MIPVCVNYVFNKKTVRFGRGNLNGLLCRAVMEEIPCVPSLHTGEETALVALLDLDSVGKNKHSGAQCSGSGFFPQIRIRIRHFFLSPDPIRKNPDPDP